MSGQTVTVPARHGGNPFLRAVHALSTLGGWVAAGMLVVSVLITCQMIFVRTVLGRSTTWQTETVIYMVIAGVCLGLAYVQMVRGHVNVDLLPLVMGPRGRFLWSVTVMLVTIAVIALMVWYSFDVLQQAYARGWKSSSVWAPRIWPVWAAVAAGFSLLLLQLLSDLYALVRGIDAPFSLEES